VFHLKRKPNYFTWTPSRTKRRNQRQYWILAAVSRCCSWCTAWNRHGRNLSCLSLDEHLSQTNTSCVPKCCYKLLFCCLIWYFLVRTRIAKCFTNSSKRFRCEWTHVLLVNTTCSYLYSFCTTGVSSGLATRVTLTRVSRSTGDVGGESVARGRPVSRSIFVP
jgi:hypothetical protein